MGAASKPKSSWLLPSVLILFILQVLLFPLAVGTTYSGRSESPDHILTYSKGSLVWDRGTEIEKSGAAKLSLFDEAYDGTVRSDDDRVVAPGTAALHMIRLKNSASGEISYTAMLYQLRSDPALPVKACLQGVGFADAATYTLPENISRSQIVRCVSGTVKSGGIQDFDISWLWDYYDSSQQDRLDTDLGDRAAEEQAPDITLGFYITVQDGNSYVGPQPPKTGDSAAFGGYIALMCISGAALVLLLISRGREQKKNG